MLLSEGVHDYFLSFVHFSPLRRDSVRWLAHYPRTFILSIREGIYPGSHEE